MKNDQIAFVFSCKSFLDNRGWLGHKPFSLLHHHPVFLFLISISFNLQLISDRTHRSGIRTQFAWGCSPIAFMPASLFNSRIHSYIIGSSLPWWQEPWYHSSGCILWQQDCRPRCPVKDSKRDCRCYYFKSHLTAFDVDSRQIDRLSFSAFRLRRPFLQFDFPTRSFTLARICTSLQQGQACLSIGEAQMINIWGNSFFMDFITVCTKAKFDAIVGIIRSFIAEVNCLSPAFSCKYISEQWLL
jgi:hypothetical protein